MSKIATPKLIRLTTVPISMNIILKGQLAFLNQYFEVVGVTGFHEKHFPEIEKREGIRMIRVDMARAISPLKDFQALWKLYLVFRKERPAIVHTQTPKAGLLGMVAAWLARVPIRFHTVGGMPLMETSGIKRIVLTYMERFTYACAHRVYPNSFGLLQIISMLNLCKPEKMKVLANGGSNGIDINFFRPNFAGDEVIAKRNFRQQHSLPENDFVFLFVGRIAKEKGIEELVTAFEALQKSTTEKMLKLLFIGPFEETYGTLSETVKGRIKANKSIFLPGRFDDVRPFYSMSDVYVFPSYREGFPNTLLEAGAMGLPIIATNINGCNEIVEDDVNGILLPVKDAFRLEEAMRALLTETEKCERLAGSARAVIEKRFRRELVWNNLVGEYHSFLNKEIVL